MHQAGQARGGHGNLLTMMIIATKTITFSEESVQRTQRFLFVAFGWGSAVVIWSRQVTYFPTPFYEVGMAQGAEDTIQE